MEYIISQTHYRIYLFRLSIIKLVGKRTIRPAFREAS
jgi:hypothetical protein